MCMFFIRTDSRNPPDPRSKYPVINHPLPQVVPTVPVAFD